MSRFIEIMDTTLRDGEQTSGVSYSPKEKLTIAKLLIEELNIDRIEEGDFEEIFLMPQQVCHLTLAKAYGLKYKQVACLDDLETAIEWSFSLSTNVLIRVCTNSIEDHRLRVNLNDDLKKTLSENLSSFD